MEIAIIALTLPFSAGSIDLAAVKPRPLFRVAEKIVGDRDLLEFLLGLLIAGVEVRVQLFCEAAIG